MIEECIDSATGQETQLAVLGTIERVLYTVQSIRNVLHYDALQKEPESYGSARKLRETGGTYRPELDGNSGTLWNILEATCIVQARARLAPTLTHVVTYELVTSGAEDKAMSGVEGRRKEERSGRREGVEGGIGPRPKGHQLKSQAKPGA